MSNFTYEKQATHSPLETFEWDNVWWEHTENTTAKRVVYIGDSISCATRHVATELSGNTVLFDGFGTSKGLDNPYYRDSLALFFKQVPHTDAVLFNNGLHGWHLSDGEYEQKYREMLTFLRSVSDAPLFVVLTTNLQGEDERNATVDCRNEIAQRLAAEFGCPCIDLHTVALEYDSLHANDHVHFTQAGYERLAEHILKRLAENGI